MTCERHGYGGELMRCAPTARTAVLCLALMFACAIGSRADSWLWNVDADANWNANNWTNQTTGAVTGFPNSSTDTATFASAITANRTVTLGINVSLDSVLFNDDNAYTLTGSRLSLYSATTGFTQSGSGAVTINSEIRLESAQTWNGSGTGIVTVNGAITDGGGITRLTKSGSFTLVLNGANTYDGLTIESGIVELGSDTAIGDRELLLNGGTIRAGGGARTFVENVEIGGNFTIGGANEITFSGNVAVGTITRIITVDSSGATLFSGTVSGSGGVTKAGLGTLALSGNNSFDGTVTLNAGVLNIRHSDGLGSTTGGVTVHSGAALELQGGIDIGTEALTLSGTGVSNGGALRNISGANSGSGAITLADAVRINSDAGTLTLSGAFSGSQALTIGGSGNVTLSGVLGTGSGTLTKDGSGNLTLSGTSANTFTGLTTVNAGTLDLQKTAGLNAIAGDIAIGDGTGTDTVRLLAANQIVDTASLTLASSGVFNLNGFAETLSSVSASSSAAQVQLGIGTLTINTTASPTFAGSISGTGVLVKQGTGKLTLSGSSTYTGATTLSAGILNVQNANALGTTAGGVSVTSGAALELQGGIAVGAEALTLNGSGISSGGALRNISGNNSWAGAITLGSASRVSSDAGSLTLSGAVSGSGLALTVGGSGDVTVSGAIGTGSGTVTKVGSGTLTLSGANTYTGLTTISEGTLKLGASDRMADSASLNIASGTFHLNGSFSEVINQLSFADGTLEFGTPGTANHFLFLSEGTSSGLLTVKNWQDGIDRFAITNGVSLTAGFLNSVYFSGYGSGAVLDDANSSVGSYGGLWDFILPNTTFETWDGGGADDNWTTGANWASDSAPLTGPSLRVEFDGSTRLTPDLNSAYTLNTLRFNSTAGSFTLGGSSTLTFDGTLPSIIQLSANNQTISSPVALNATTITDVSGAGSLTISGAASGAGGIDKLGASALVLSGNNSFSGAVTVGAGTVNIRHANALGTTAAGTTVSSGAALEIQGGIAVGSEALTLNSSGISAAGALRNISGVNSWSGAITLGSATRINADAGTLTLSGGISGSGFNLSLGGSGNLTLSGAVTTGTGGLTKDGGGTLTLSGAGANTLSGAIAVNEGTLVLNKTAGINAIASALTIGDGTGGSGADIVQLGANNQIANTVAVTIGASGRLDLNGKTETIGSLAGSSSGAQVTLGIGTLTLGDATSTSFAGVISGTGGLTKLGTGTLTLSGANTFSGAVALSAGVLNLQNSTAIGTTAGGLTVTSGAALELQGGISIGAEALTLNGSGVSSGGALRNVSGANSWSGAIALGSASQISSDAGTLTLAGAISGGGRDLTVTGAGNLVLDGIIGTTSGSLTKSGTGTLTLSGNNTFSGGSTINAGTVALGHNSALGSGSVTLTGGGLEASGGSRSIANTIALQGDLTISGSDALTFSGAWTQSGANRTVTINNSAATTISGGVTLAENNQTRTLTLSVGDGGLTISSVIANGAGSGADGLTKAGSGTLTLSGANTYTGATTINAGTVALAASDRISDSSNLLLTGGGIDLGGTFSERVGTLSYNTGSIDFGTTGTANYFMFSDDGNTPTAPLVLFNWENGTDQLAFLTANTLSASFLNNIYFAGFGSVAELGLTSQTISGYGGAIWTFLKPSAQFYDTWDGGHSNDDWTSNNNWTDNSAPPGGTTTKVAFDGSVRLTPNLNQDRTINSLRFNTNASSFTISSSAGRTLTFGGIIPSVFQHSANDQTINVETDLDATLFVDGTGAGGLTMANVVSGTGGMNKYGSYRLTLSGNNTYSGATLVSAGIVRLEHNNALGSTTAGVTVNSGAALELTSGITIDGEALTLNGTGVSSGGALRSVSGANSWAGNVALSSGSRINADAGTLTLSGAISGAAQSLTLGGAGDILVSGVIGTTTGTLTKDGAGTATLSGTSANTFTGLTTVNEGTLLLNKTAGINAIGGSLTIGDGIGGAGADIARLSAANQIPNSAAVTIDSSGRLDLNGNAETIGSLAGASSAAELLLGAATLTVGDTTSTTFAGAISGTGAVVKQASGTLTLSGSSSYSGTTTVNAGAINVQHASALGSTAAGTTVASGAALEIQGGVAVGSETLTISGTGTSGAGALRNISGGNSWAGAVTLNATSTIGADSGTLTLNGAVSNGGNTLTIAGSGNTTLGAAVSGAGGLTKEGAGTLTLTGASSFAGNINIVEGTLLLGASERIGNSTSMTLSGGTFGTGGFSETVSTLTLTANSIIDLGSGASILSFANSSGASWTGGATVEIWNWNGSIAGGPDQLFFGTGADGLAPGQVAQIVFRNPNGGSGVWPAQILPSGEVVPVPEPATVCVLVLIGLGLAWRERGSLRRLRDCLLQLKRAIR